MAWLGWVPKRTGAQGFNFFVLHFLQRVWILICECSCKSKNVISLLTYKDCGILVKNASQITLQCEIMHQNLVHKCNVLRNFNKILLWFIVYNAGVSNGISVYTSVYKQNLIHKQGYTSDWKTNLSGAFMVRPIIFRLPALKKFEGGKIFRLSKLLKPCFGKKGIIFECRKLLNNGRRFEQWVLLMLCVLYVVALWKQLSRLLCIWRKKGWVIFHVKQTSGFVHGYVISMGFVLYYRIGWKIGLDVLSHVKSLLILRLIAANFWSIPLLYAEYKCYIWIPLLYAWRWREVRDSSQSFSSDTLQGISSEWSGDTTELVYIQKRRDLIG